MNKFEVVLIFNPELSTTNLKSEIENFKTKLNHNLQILLMKRIGV